MAVITARITRVFREEGSDWIRIETDHETVKRLDTKDEQRAAQAVAARTAGEPVDIDFKSVPSKNTNPHTGQPYPPSHYFNGVLEQAKPAASGIETVTKEAETQRPTDPATAWRISLAAGAKLALSSLAYMPNAESLTFEDYQQMALAWGFFLYTTPFPSDPVAVAGDGAVPLPELDDIPF